MQIRDLSLSFNIEKLHQSEISQLGGDIHSPRVTCGRRSRETTDVTISQQKAYDKAAKCLLVVCFVRILIFLLAHIIQAKTYTLCMYEQEIRVWANFIKIRKSIFFILTLLYVRECLSLEKQIYLSSLILFSLKWYILERNL